MTPKNRPVLMKFDTLQAAAFGTRRQPDEQIWTSLPRSAMHKRGLCRHAVSVCLSRSWVASKRI